MTGVETRTGLIGPLDVHVIGMWVRFDQPERYLKRLLTVIGHCRNVSDRMWIFLRRPARWLTRAVKAGQHQSDSQARDARHERYC